MPARSGAFRSPAKGLTFPELLIAISITTVIAAAAAAVALAVSSAQNDADDSHSCVQTARVARLRVSRRLHRASLIIAIDARRVALWMGDTNDNGQINLDELTVLSYQPDSGELHRYWKAFPDWVPQFLKDIFNRSYALNDVTNTVYVENELVGGWLGQSEVVAADIDSVTFTMDPAPPLTRFARVGMVVSVGDASSETAAAATLRADRTDDVTYGGGVYRLEGE
ncbi:MAG: prepilin-type N-terminal cleavage/methylation domain-containing protein [Phycisphaerae bacterium]|nr:prepilin-type N-terminal cleavage/methylation domain-containing protein [Phycisphaerae bacterium]